MSYNSQNYNRQLSGQKEVGNQCQSRKIQIVESVIIDNTIVNVVIVILFLQHYEYSVLKAYT